MDVGLWVEVWWWGGTGALKCVPASASRLEELFLCLNAYASVSPSCTTCPSLHLLHMTDNQLRDWTEVRNLGSLFPGLSSLVLANNPLASVDDCGDAFPNLRSINLNNSGLTRRTGPGVPDPLTSDL